MVPLTPTAVAIQQVHVAGVRIRSFAGLFPKQFGQDSDVPQPQVEALGSDGMDGVGGITQDHSPRPDIFQSSNQPKRVTAALSHFYKIAQVVSEARLSLLEKLRLRHRHHPFGLVRRYAPDQAATAIDVRHHRKWPRGGETLKRPATVVLFRRDVANHGGLAVIVSFGFNTQRFPDKRIRAVCANQQGCFDSLVTIFTGKFNGGGIIIDANTSNSRRTEEIQPIELGQSFHDCSTENPGLDDVAKTVQTKFGRVHDDTPWPLMLAYLDFADRGGITLQGRPDAEAFEYPAGTGAERQRAVVVAGLGSCAEDHGLNQRNFQPKWRQRTSEAGSHQSTANDRDIVMTVPGSFTHADCRISISHFKPPSAPQFRLPFWRAHPSISVRHRW